MPNPLDARIHGDWQDIYAIDKDRSYLVSFLYHGEGASGDVHVNFRWLPGAHDDPALQDRRVDGQEDVARYDAVLLRQRGRAEGAGHSAPRSTG